MLKLIIKWQEYRIYKLKEKALKLLKAKRQDVRCQFTAYNCIIESTLKEDDLPDVYIYANTESLFYITNRQMIRENNAILKCLRLYINLIKSGLIFMSRTSCVSLSKKDFIESLRTQYFKKEDK